MTTYAKNTPVGVDRTIAEIYQILRKFGATDIGHMENRNMASVVFAKDERHIKFVLPIPSREDFTYTDTRRIKRSESSITQAWEQAIADRYRALALAIKSKVVSVDTGIESFEQAFMAHIVVPGTGRVAGEIILPQIADAYEGKQHPLMLQAPRED